ncbi:MAG: ChbG/HpnK family deacetylase [Candidatus Omnitrophica bacterium]|nr:ChbG/HpnK family deacetylase [Candidatus Omnitrophota bacterium]
MTKVIEKMGVKFPETDFPYALAVKYSFLLLFIFALAFILYVGNKSFFSPWTMLIVIIFAVFRLWHFGSPELEQRVYGTIAYPSRGAAIFIFSSIFIAFAGSKPLLFFAGCLLLWFYHKGMALILLPILSLTILIHKKISDKAGDKIPTLSWTFPLLICCLSIPSLLFQAKILPQLNSAVALPTELTPYWMIAIKSLFYVGIFYWLFKRIKLPNNISRLREARFVEIISLFLTLSFCLGLILSLKNVQSGLMTTFRSQLLLEMPYRMVGAQYFLIVVLFIIMIKNACLEHLSKLNNVQTKRLTVISAIAFIIICPIYLKFIYPYRYLQFFKGKINFLKNDCENIKANPNIKTLDPNQEPEFFYSLSMALKYRGLGYENLTELLNLPPNRYLIIIADDLGLNHATNQAFFNAVEKGAIKSGSIMVKAPAYKEIAEFAKQHPELDWGVHLTITNEWSTFRNPGGYGSGYMPDSCSEALNKFGFKEIKKEFKAQIDQALADNIKLSHLDIHMGCEYQSLKLLYLYEEIGREYKLPVRIGRNYLPRSIEKKIPADTMVLDRIIERKMVSCSVGVSLLLLHPSIYEEASVKQTSEETAKEREADYQFLMSDELKRIIDQNKIKLITWQDLK